MRLRGVTVDTGFLVALERSKQRAIELAALASTRSIRVTLPVAVLAEWWRGGRRQARYLKGSDERKTSMTSLGRAIVWTSVAVLLNARARRRDHTFVPHGGEILASCRSA